MVLAGNTLAARYMGIASFGLLDPGRHRPLSQGKGAKDPRRMAGGPARRAGLAVLEDGAFRAAGGKGRLAPLVGFCLFGRRGRFPGLGSGFLPEGELRAMDPGFADPGSHFAGGCRDALYRHADVGISGAR